MTSPAIASDSSAVVGRARRDRLLKLGSWVLYAYPALLVASLYGTWFVAWLVLGAQPRPSLDDPKSIGLLVDVPYALTMGMLMLAPGALLIGVGRALFALVGLFERDAQGAPRKSATARVTRFSLFLLLWCAVLWLLRYDPWSVGNWFMD